MARTQVQSELIATNAISGTIIADNAITATHIATNSISGTLVQDSGIVTSMIAANNVTAAKIVSDGVEHRHLHSNVISGLSTVTAASGDFLLIGDTSDSDNLKKALVSDIGADGITASGSNTIIQSPDNTNVLYVNNSADVGIGTSSPANNLHIFTDAGDEGITIKSTGNTSNAIIMDANRSGAGNSIGEIQSKWNGTAVTMVASLTGSDTTNKDNGQLKFYTSSANNLAERMVIDDEGNVGIGTSGPARLLHVKSSNANLASFEGHQGEGVVIVSNTNGRIDIVGYDDGASSYNNLVIRATGSYDQLLFDSSGHIGIPPGRRFYLDNTSIASGDTYIDEYSANEVGITTGGSRKLAVSGGNLYVSGSVNASHNFSDERLKENIVVIPNALEKVSSLRGITFTRKDNGNVGTGLIAQELEKVLPEAVYKSKKVDTLDNPDAEEWKAINYGNTVGLLVEAIKELEARIKELEG